MKKLGILITCLLVTNYVHAQNEPIVKLFNEYVDAINNLYQTKDINTIKSLFAEEFKVNQTTIGLSGSVKTRTNTLGESMRGFENMAKSDLEITPNLKITEIIEVDQGANSATISAKLSTDLVIDGKAAQKSSYTTTMIAAKSKMGEWQFVHSDNVTKINERTSGDCYCYFYERGKTDFVTMLYYPAGLDYQRTLNAFFTRKKGSEGIVEIKTDSGLFTWSNGEVASTSSENGMNVVGSASSSKEAIATILKNMYSDNCQRLLLK